MANNGRYMKNDHLLFSQKLLSFKGTLLKDDTVVDDIGLVSGNTLLYKQVANITFKKISFIIQKSVMANNGRYNEELP